MSWSDPVRPEGPAAQHAAALVADIEHALAEGRPDEVPAETLQALMTAACRLYSAQIEAGATHLPITANISSTDIMATASGLLKAGNLAVFELGMWQSWTGR
jgi:hypothetical protein